MNNLTLIAWGTSILVFVAFVGIFIGIKIHSKDISSKKEIKELLNIIASLKLRVFDHEKYILNKDGVYIPEDMGEYYFKQTWGTLDNSTRKIINDEYKMVCPSSIPLWKYFLYSYRPKIEVVRKIELKKIDSLEELINLSTESVEKLEKSISDLEAISKNYSNIKKTIGKIDESTDKIDRDMQEIEEEN
ncbi:hypothetical protein [Clostridium sardiniense]|uniref:hypothetical protein n=1 Tax=Clostridium sardiniense TaxID=29369 RepID=UPI001959A21C|nr:hypothetical protein [Clostridium sardiniense]MBM7835934.1 hypothetical protein [Clostridium sardiniense]